MTVKRFAVIGNPIEHSLSPEIHLAFANQVGIPLSYVKLYSDINKFEQTVSHFIDEGGLGLNVTAPFKRNAFLYSQVLDDKASISGAVNTLQIKNEEVWGYNTDGVGLVSDLARLNWPLQNQKLLILGAGGATQGILQPLLNAGAEITVANRTISKANAIKTSFPNIDTCGLEEIPNNASLVVNATATGWHKNELPIELNKLEGAYCYDLTYAKNGKTTFIEQVKGVAAGTADGLGMLVEQAATAFQIWHGVLPHTQSVLSELRTPKTRYIAGAVCPRCHKQDSLYITLNLLGAPVMRNCNACDFHDDPDGNVAVSLKPK